MCSGLLFLQSGFGKSSGQLPGVIGCDQPGIKVPKTRKLSLTTPARYVVARAFCSLSIFWLSPDLIDMGAGIVSFNSLSIFPSIRLKALPVLSVHPSKLKEYLAISVNPNRCVWQCGVRCCNRLRKRQLFVATCVPAPTQHGYNANQPVCSAPSPSNLKRQNQRLT